MPQWPHWYVLREDGRARKFDFVNALIKKFGYPDLWGNRTKYYMALGKFKYWIEDNVLNRAAPISNAEVRTRNSKWLARTGKKSDLTEDRSASRRSVVKDSMRRDLTLMLLY